MQKGLILDIYKNPSYSRCSNNGISSVSERVLWVGEGAPQIFEAPELPRVYIVKGNLPGTIKAVPADKNFGAMAGGCFVYTSDSRLSEYVGKIIGHRFYGAISLHDRFE